MEKRKSKFPFLTPFILVVKHRVFQGTVFIAVVLNCIVLCLDRDDINEKEELAYTILNDIFYGIFVLEMVVKLLGLGFHNYFIDKFNCFDCFLVVAATVDITLSSATSFTLQGTSALQTLRGFRLIRMFKLTREWTQLQNLLQLMKKALSDLWPLGIIFMIYLFTYTILGREWFAYKAKFDENWNIDLVNGKFID